MIKNWKKKFFAISFKLATMPLKLVEKKRRPLHEDLITKMKTSEEGTIGKELFYFLEKNQLQLIPYFESHDLKHVILGYGTEITDELQLISFTFGNIKFPFFITYILWINFVLWTPETWKNIVTHYNMGKTLPPVSQYPVQKLLHIPLKDFRKEIGLQETIHKK